MTVHAVIVFLLIGLLPDEPNRTTLHLPPNGDASLALRSNFWRAGVFWSSVKEISLTNSPLFILVDDEDFDRANSISWRLASDGTAIRNVKSNGKWTYQAIHIFLFPAPNGMVRDHRNHDVLDNRRSNIRICTPAENSRNRVISSEDKTSRFKGVCWHSKGSKWVAHIRYNYIQIHLGLFVNEIDAARAYNAAALRYHGEFAYLNPV